jgi:hypothetical protein
MNQGQENFFNFIMARVQEGKQGEAKTLLEESFGKQDGGTFNAAYIDEFQAKLLPLLKPGAAEEMKPIISGFRASHTQC